MNPQGPCSNCGQHKSLHSAVTMGRNLRSPKVIASLRWFCSDLYNYEKDKDDPKKQFINSTLTALETAGPTEKERP